MGINPTDMVVFDPGRKCARRHAHQYGAATAGAPAVGDPSWWVPEMGCREPTGGTDDSDDRANGLPADPGHGRFYRGSRPTFEQRLNDKETVIVDTRPRSTYTGEKSREMRPGRIPGAINRVYKARPRSAGNLKSRMNWRGPMRTIIPAQRCDGGCLLPHGPSGQSDIFCTQGDARLPERQVVRRQLDRLGQYAHCQLKKGNAMQKSVPGMRCQESDFFPTECPLKNG